MCNKKKNYFPCLEEIQPNYNDKFYKEFAVLFVSGVKSVFANNNKKSS